MSALSIFLITTGAVELALIIMLALVLLALKIIHTAEDEDDGR